MKQVRPILFFLSFISFSFAGSLDDMDFRSRMFSYRKSMYDILGDSRFSLDLLISNMSTLDKNPVFMNMVHFKIPAEIEEAVKSSHVPHEVLWQSSIGDKIREALESSQVENARTFDLVLNGFKTEMILTFLTDAPVKSDFVRSTLVKNGHIVFKRNGETVKKIDLDPYRFLSSIMLPNSFGGVKIDYKGEFSKEIRSYIEEEFKQEQESTLSFELDAFGKGTSDLSAILPINANLHIRYGTSFPKSCYLFLKHFFTGK